MDLFCCEGLITIIAADALPFTECRRVLDIACGTGYGLSTLRASASTVVGVDVDASAAATARRVNEGAVLVSYGSRVARSPQHALAAR